MVWGTENELREHALFQFTNLSRSDFASAIMPQDTKTSTDALSPSFQSMSLKSPKPIEPFKVDDLLGKVLTKQVAKDAKKEYVAERTLSLDDIKVEKAKIEETFPVEMTRDAVKIRRGKRARYPNQIRSAKQNLKQWEAELTNLNHIKASDDAWLMLDDHEKHVGRLKRNGAFGDASLQREYDRSVKRQKRYESEQYVEDAVQGEQDVEEDVEDAVKGEQGDAE